MTYVIAQPCVDLKDRACVDECPVDCIYEGKRMLYIHPDECVDCGACEPVCPVEAIFYEDDTPEEWKDYYDANVHFFDDLGSPGGAAKMGEIDKDHPLIAALPPQNAGRTDDGRPARRAGLRAGSPTSPGTSSTAYAERARAHPDGIVDLSVGTPVDPTPEVVQQALRGGRRLAGLPADDRPAPRPGRRRVDWLARRHGVTGLGLDGGAAGDRLQGADRLAADAPRARAPATWSSYPELAYPTYEVGAALAGARARRHRLADRARPASARPLLWLNSPSNPTGRVLPLEHLRKVVDWCRERGTLLVSDECYLECAWEAEPGLGAAPRRLRRLATRASSPCTRCRSAPTWPATAARFVAGDPARGRRAARRPQEPRADDARPAAGRDGRGAGRRRARRRAARALRRPACDAAGGAGGAPASGSTTPRRRSTSGPPATRTAGTPSPARRAAASWSRPGTFYGRAGAPARPGRASPPPTSASPPLPLGSEPAERPGDSRLVDGRRRRSWHRECAVVVAARHRELVVLVEGLGHRRVGHGLRDAHREIDSSRTTECSECVLRMTPWPSTPATVPRSQWPCTSTSTGRWLFSARRSAVPTVKIVESVHEKAPRLESPPGLCT